ncbi:hypothetical protein M408DRAFT_98599 [Serendipita vermifera MAFF 305830]|uniref:Uncharacterized protein n=1 Tax=Serendipita vermifera MAFF 305830 TaxID=933852 RepID=A0A0C3BEM0_SERVB|nr:hypothetical protein M408DRAFT_98370 [Serendipita vermifera MAFF 305830]KIM29906.1 hypothetical protein M408DRAFT_98599 [Serendipita vermifera MAFF 305830]
MEMRVSLSLRFQRSWCLLFNGVTLSDELGSRLLSSIYLLKCCVNIKRRLFSCPEGG